MLKALATILNIQELDMKMLRLMKLKREREKELKNIATLRGDLQLQLEEKQKEIKETEQAIQMEEAKILEIKDRLKKLEQKQGSIKKVEEFNALTQEMSSAERERVATEHKASDLIDKKNAEEEILVKIQQTLSSTEDNSKAIVKEIQDTIAIINKEGNELKAQRDQLLPEADPHIFKIYEKLLMNKKDRVVVPIENRTCSGCHIALTAQHENLVRKGERLVFCEHCSRILFWQADAEEVEGPRRRRRKVSA